MLKKDQVLQALENGGRIMVDSIYRTARVLDENGNEVDTCRYDTADRIERSAGYTRRKTDWYANWFIEKEQPTQEEEEAAFAAWMDAGSDAWDAESARVQAAVSANLPGLVTEEQPAPDYLKIKAPTSNEESGVYYQITHRAKPAETSWPERTQTLYTVDAVENAVYQIKAGGGYITEAQRVEVSAGSFEVTDFTPETSQERTDRENREHCKRIADELELYASGGAYKCPHCCEVHNMDEYEETEHENEDGYTCYTCPHCGEEIEEDDLEAVSLYDFFEDCLDIEYRCDSKREYRSVCIMIACGGPNIYIDTEEKAVLLYWWSDRARYYLSGDTAEAVDEWAREYWECL